MIVAVVLFAAVAFIVWSGFIHGRGAKSGFRRGHAEGVREGRRGP